MESLAMSIAACGEVNAYFWSGKRVFLTGHTGFKGGWLTVWLSSMGAKVIGFSLPPSTNPSLFEIARVDALCEKSYIKDIRNLDELCNAMQSAKPDIVIHMAAQPLVRYSYINPVETYSTNLMGTVHVLEAIRICNSVKAVVVVTTDKCYENKEWVWGYREDEPMGGHDPYSNSKGCAELAVASYRQSFFSESKYAEHGVAIASARAGNVIGGGDWSADRLVPDAIAAFEFGRALKLRNPSSIRPWQHVLEPLSGYLVLAQALYEEGVTFSGAWNFGPIDTDARPVKDVIELIIDQWGGSAAWEEDDCSSPHEANFLKLDCSKARQKLAWSSRWSLEEATAAIIQWQKVFRSNGNVRSVMHSQIDKYCNSPHAN